MIETYRLLAKGEPVSQEQITEATGLAPERGMSRCEHGLWYCATKTIGSSDSGGMQAHHVKPIHAMDHGNATVYGWCAIDTLFISEIISREMRVESTDPTSGSRIRLTVSPDGDRGPATVRPDGLLEPLVERMNQRNAPHVLVTTPQGQLMGILFRDEARRLLAGERPAQIWRECEGVRGRWAPPGD